MSKPTPGSPAKVIPIADGGMPQRSAKGEANHTKTVWLYEKHHKLYPRSVKGWFASWRWALVWFTQLVFYGLPWLTWNGRPAMLFDLQARRFYIFELILYPQDFIYLTALLVISAYGLFFFTAVAGRLWCGYACPQTVYTEMFLWVEKLFEGERGARIKLDSGPWDGNRIARKTGKHIVWILIGLWTGITFVGYFTPIRELLVELAAFTLGPWEWFWVLFYGFATYGNAGFLREQVCKYMCPYARFQSAMVDHDTLVVSYDAERGEPRGTRARSADFVQLGLGSCIDCELCVHVCPTGIDIRDGLQYECIACSACIDACDGVMAKMHYPRGLIRYATQNALSQHLDKAAMWKRVLRPRVLLYGAVLVAISIAFVVSLTLRSPLRVDIVRDRGSLARQVEDGQIENIYRMQLMNASAQPQQLAIDVQGLDGATLTTNGSLELAPTEGQWVMVHLRLPYERAQALGAGAHPIRFRVHGKAGERAVEQTEKSTFVVPR